MVPKNLRIWYSQPWVIRPCLSLMNVLGKLGVWWISGKVLRWLFGSFRSLKLDFGKSNKIFSLIIWFSLQINLFGPNSGTPVRGCTCRTGPATLVCKWYIPCISSILNLYSGNLCSNCLKVVKFYLTLTVQSHMQQWCWQNSPPTLTRDEVHKMSRNIFSFYWHRLQRE